MRRPNTKKAFAAMTFILLALGASLAYGLMSGHPVNAKSAHSQPNMPAAASSSMTLAAAQSAGITMPKVPIYALNSNNVILVLTPGTTNFTRLVRVTKANGNLIGIDFRPGDGKNTALYALTDTGALYTINLTANGLGNVTKVSDMTTRFPSGVQSLMDFNPMVNALRLIGSERLNYAVVNSGGNLNAMAIQTSLSYDPNDVNRGVLPHVSAGTYTNNFASATTTRFYGIDYDLDTFVTIQSATPGGPSATGGGVLQTLGPLVSPTGQRINLSSTADIDIYSNTNENSLFGGPVFNNLVGVSGQTLFTIDLSKINPAVPAGSVSNIVVNGITMPDDGNNIIDIAAALNYYEAENATLGGGATVNTSFPGFTATGVASLGNGVAGAFAEFQVNHNGTQVIIFRYANGSTVARPCNFTINGVNAGTLNFPPTGSWTTYRTTKAAFILGPEAGFRSFRVTATTAAGGPNLDNLEFFAL